MKHTVCGNKVYEREAVDLQNGEWNYYIEIICDNCKTFVDVDELDEELELAQSAIESNEPPSECGSRRGCIKG